MEKKERELHASPASSAKKENEQASSKRPPGISEKNANGSASSKQSLATPEKTNYGPASSKQKKDNKLHVSSASSASSKQKKTNEPAFLWKKKEMNRHPHARRMNLNYMRHRHPQRSNAYSRRFGWALVPPRSQPRSSTTGMISD